MWAVIEAWRRQIAHDLAAARRLPAGIGLWRLNGGL